MQLIVDDEFLELKEIGVCGMRYRLALERGSGEFIRFKCNDRMGLNAKIGAYPECTQCLAQICEGLIAAQNTKLNKLEMVGEFNRDQ